MRIRKMFIITRKFFKTCYYPCIVVKITAPSEVANSFNRMNRRASSFVQRQKRSGSLLSPTTPSRRSSEVQSIIQSNKYVL